MKLIPIKETFIDNKIIILRDERVILDMHLAELYEVETRVLKQAVRRNIERFPDDFMFELTDDEIDIMVSQDVIPSRQVLGGALPFAFTENGVAMISSVLKNKKSIEVNISIMRAFTLLRKLFQSESEIKQELEDIKGIVLEQGSSIQILFDYVNQLEKIKEDELSFKKRTRIGYKQSDKQL